MAKTYAQIQKQIDVLAREAEKLKRKEVDEVVARIKEAIAAYGLTAADLGLRASRKAAATSARKSSKGQRKTKGARAAKYRDGADNVWGGRGPRPQWLRDALASGKKLEDFAV